MPTRYWCHHWGQNGTLIFCLFEHSFKVNVYFFGRTFYKLPLFQIKRIEFDYVFDLYCWLRWHSGLLQCWSKTYGQQVEIYRRTCTITKKLRLGMCWNVYEIMNFQFKVDKPGSQTPDVWIHNTVNNLDIVPSAVIAVLPNMEAQEFKLEFLSWIW